MDQNLDRLKQLATQHFVTKYQTLLDEARRQEAIPPANFKGRGIVVCAGGPRYFACAWVLIHQLREVLRCALPVQIWYAGPREMDDRMIALLSALTDVECVDATHHAGYERTASGGGWALKPFAIIHSRFNEVLMLDADNLPLVNPEFLFDDPHYIETGAIFWPDLHPIPSESILWEVTRVPYRNEPSFESGQMVIDKSRCWKPLQLTMHLNENAKFYYEIMLGDKDTFHFAWHMAGCRYSMPPGPPLCLSTADTKFGAGPILHQAGFDGSIIFQHRNSPKWTAFGYNPHFPGSFFEEECLAFLSRLATLWDGRMYTPVPAAPPAYYESPSGTLWFRYLRLSIGDRLIELLPNGQIGFGAMKFERTWALGKDRDQPVLTIAGDFGITCRLTKENDGVWRGRWQLNERSFVELIPFVSSHDDTDELASLRMSPAVWNRSQAEHRW